MRPRTARAPARQAAATPPPRGACPAPCSEGDDAVASVNQARLPDGRGRRRETSLFASSSRRGGDLSPTGAGSVRRRALQDLPQRLRSQPDGPGEIRLRPGPPRQEGGQHLADRLRRSASPHARILPESRFRPTDPEPRHLPLGPTPSSSRIRAGTRPGPLEDPMRTVRAPWGAPRRPPRNGGGIRPLPRDAPRGGSNGSLRPVRRLREQREMTARADSPPPKLPRHLP